MKITKRHENPAPYFVQLGARLFWFTFESMKNNINGHPRRSVKVIYKTDKGGQLWARSYIIVLNYETESDAARDLAERIAEEIEQKRS